MFLGYYFGGEVVEIIVCILGYSLYFKSFIEEDKIGIVEFNCICECIDLFLWKFKIKGELIWLYLFLVGWFVIDFREKWCFGNGIEYDG